MTDAAMATGPTPRPLEIVDRQARNRTAVRRWLYIVLLCLFALVMVGGATRLTDSGLSITEWKPIHGIIPPLSQAEWEKEFVKYQQIPEYQQINKGMTLEEFKGIFWWEWAHRFLARSVGFLFAIPLAFFWLTGRLERRLKPRLVGLLALGGLQGAVGWWMVASGLTERTDVSQYRLAIHLTLASIIFASIMYVARGLAVHSGGRAMRETRNGAIWMVGLVLFQIYLGALVAGLDAGFTYNTWPLMDGAVVPGGLWIQHPWWINAFENPKTVQFIHRCGAYLVLAAAIIHMLRTMKREPETTHARRSLILAGLVVLQACIGITTLLLHVPLGWGLIHQATALVVLGFAVAHWRGTIGSYVPETGVVVRH